MAGIATRGTDGNAMGVCGVDSDGFRRAVPIGTAMGITIPVRTTDDTAKRVVRRVTDPLCRCT